MSNPPVIELGGPVPEIEQSLKLMLPYQNRLMSRTRIRRVTCLSISPSGSPNKPVSTLNPPLSVTARNSKILVADELRITTLHNKLIINELCRYNSGAIDGLNYAL